jgi:hypothetical protein
MVQGSCTKEGTDRGRGGEDEEENIGRYSREEVFQGGGIFSRGILERYSREVLYSHILSPLSQVSPL